MTDSEDDFPVDDETDVGIAEDQLEALDEQLGEDVDIEDIDIELEQEYWVDYNHSHHGIVFCWRNNKKQILLGIEESISPSQEPNGYDIVLMNSSGGYIGVLESFDDEEEALKKALEYQHEYPQGDFPLVESYQEAKDDDGNVKRGWMIDDNPLYEDSSGNAEDTVETEREAPVSNETTLLAKLRSIFPF